MANFNKLMGQLSEARKLTTTSIEELAILETSLASGKADLVDAVKALRLCVKALEGELEAVAGGKGDAYKDMRSAVNVGNWVIAKAEEREED